MRLGNEGYGGADIEDCAEGGVRKADDGLPWRVSGRVYRGGLAWRVLPRRVAGRASLGRWGECMTLRVTVWVKRELLWKERLGGDRVEKEVDQGRVGFLWRQYLGDASRAGKSTW